MLPWPARQSYTGYKAAAGFGFSLGLVLLAGCAIAPRHPVPKDLTNVAHLAGLDDARIELDFSESNTLRRLSQFLKGWNSSGDADHHLHILSLSGGGENGAYGAGLLCGWTEAKTRPEFDLVTGVSTGSLIAPFAFLGLEFDPQLRHCYTEIEPSRIYVQRGLFGILKHRDSLAESKPLEKLIAEMLGERELAAIAREHRKGRRLLVMTTNLDAQKPVIWDIGEIASSGRPDALEIVHKVLLASSSIPVFFPPVLFKVEAEGRRYDELHVDGGVAAQVFGGALLLAESAQTRADTLIDFYLVRNARIAPQFQATRREIIDIARRSVETMMKIQGLNDVLRLWVFCRARGGVFHYVSIPDDFQTELKQPFDPDYMKALFHAGYEQGQNGIPWRQVPAGLDELDSTPVGRKGVNP